MSHGHKKSAMLEEIQRHIVALEESIHDISTARKHLKQNSMEVKHDIQMTVTQQLEALRERELHLLRQVDLVQQVKDAALQGQEQQLHTALGGLNNLLQWQDPHSTRESLARDTLDRLKSLELHPDQTPISFKADLARLNQSICSFGSIDSRGLSMNALFDSDLTSKSMPRPFEDYEDDDHHVLYKSVGDTSVQTGVRQVSVGIPRLSKMPEDWLFMPSENLKPVETPPSFQFPPFSSSGIVEALDKNGALHRSMSSTASIQQWLCELQAQDEGEDEDFEVVSPHHPGSSIEVLSMDGTQAYCMMPALTNSLNNLTLTQVPGMTLNQETSQIQDKAPIPDLTFAYFRDVLADPYTRWLLSGSPQESSSAYCSEILRYFRDVSNDIKFWLLDYTEKKQAGNTEELCLAKQPSIDIEDLEQLRCVTDPVSTYFNQVTSDPKHWLLGNKDEDKDEDDLEIMDAVKIMQAVCKANEPCQTFQDCISDEKCCSQINKNIVDPENKVLGFDYFKSISSETSKRWLLCDKECNLDALRVPPIENHCPFPPFSEPESNAWLLDTTKSVLPIVGASSDLGIFSKESDYAQWLDSHKILEKAPDFGGLINMWGTLFRHKTSKIAWSENQTNTVRNAPFPGFDNNLPLDQWLLTSNLDPEDEPNIESDQSLSSWLIKSETIDPFQQKFNPMLYQAWLAPLKDHRKYDIGKQCELPECMDESSCSETITNDDLFACFLNKGLDNKCWLAEREVLED